MGEAGNSTISQEKADGTQCSMRKGAQIVWLQSQTVRSNPIWMKCQYYALGEAT